MRLTTLAIAAAVIALTAAGCSSGGRAAEADAPPSPVPVAADACRAYDNAVQYIAQGIWADPMIPMLITTYGGESVRKVETAADLAEGDAREAIADTATRIQVLVDAGDVLAATAEVEAVKASIGEVKHMCTAAGAKMPHIPPGV